MGAVAGRDGSVDVESLAVSVNPSFLSDPELKFPLQTCNCLVEVSTRTGDVDIVIGTIL